MPKAVEQDAVQQFFLQEICLGEQCIATGDIESSVEHFANAIIVCGQPGALVQLLRQTLPTNVFILLVQKMTEFSETMGAKTVDDLE